MREHVPVCAYACELWMYAFVFLRFGVRVCVSVCIVAYALGYLPDVVCLSSLNMKVG